MIGEGGDANISFKFKRKNIHSMYRDFGGTPTQGKRLTLTKLTCIRTSLGLAHGIVRLHHLPST